MDQVSKQANRTQKEQDEVHAAIAQIRFDYQAQNDYTVDPELSSNTYYKSYEHLDSLVLLKEGHVSYACSRLMNAGKSIMGLDVGQPWCLYWPLNALELLEAPVALFAERVVKFITYCKKDAFCGGHHQYPHLAPTYAALLSLFIIGTDEAYKVIDRQGLETFFNKVKNPACKGSFLMHENGEADMRAVYIVVIMVVLLGLDPNIIDGCAEYIASCQTYEGGIGATPFSEAHGGYTFCGYAALVCLGKAHLIDEGKMLHWLVQKQIEGEGGFCGRTNKVVDSCYSFWQGAIFTLLGQKEHYRLNGGLLMNQEELKTYILICQSANGGIFDKPGKSPDAYHTCYALSGHSLSSSDEQDAVYNIRRVKVEQARAYFMKANQ